MSKKMNNIAYSSGVSACLDASAFSFSGGRITSYGNKDHPIQTIEKDNKKILQYELIGLNKSHITVKKNFVNKTKTLIVTVEGKYIDELTGFENEINIELPVDYTIYNKVTWKIADGILTIILHEIINEEPEMRLVEDYGFML